MLEFLEFLSDFGLYVFGFIVLLLVLVMAFLVAIEIYDLLVEAWRKDEDDEHDEDIRPFMR